MTGRLRAELLLGSASGEEWVTVGVLPPGHSASVTDHTRGAEVKYVFECRGSDSAVRRSNPLALLGWEPLVLLGAGASYTIKYRNEKGERCSLRLTHQFDGGG